jgi:hypothetical protein
VILGSWPVPVAGRCFQCCGAAAGPGCRAGLAGLHGPWGCLLSGRGDRGSASAGCQLPQALKGCGDLCGPGPWGCELEAESPSAADDPSGGREQAQPQPPGFPAACRAGECEQLGPGDQVAGQRDDLAPDLVLRVPVQRQVPQPGVLGAADAVFAAGAAAVP